jgi:hypothetical protein
MRCAVALGSVLKEADTESGLDTAAVVDLASTTLLVARVQRFARGERQL